MEVISGIISGILILAVLVTFPLGLRTRRRALKEIAELGSQLEEKTKSLVELVESLVEEEKVSRPSASEMYSGKYRIVHIKGGLSEPTIVVIKGGESRVSMHEAFLKESLVSFTKEFFSVEREEFFKIVRKEIPYEDVEKTISKSRGGWYFLTPSRYPLVEKEHAYVR